MLFSIVVLGWRGRGALADMSRQLHKGLLAGGLSFGSYLVALWAMTLAPIAAVAALRETSILFALTLRTSFYDGVPDGPGMSKGEVLVILSIVIVFTDLPAAPAKDFFAGVLDQSGLSSYVDDGLVMGPFYEGNDGTAIYNPNFRPFQSPVPMLLMRRAVISDWKFFLDNEVWLKLWARRYGEAGIEALAGELRRLPWRTKPT